MRDMHRAVERVFAAIDAHERIAIYADFDCDGVPGAALLADFFSKIRYANFEVYIPHRDLEGYGFHADAIDTLAARGVSLIITVDVGTTAIDAARHAREKGIDVIVTDHHEIVDKLPDAFAILNPKLAPYPFPNLCGTGVAFKLAHAMILEGKKRGLEKFVVLPEGAEKWFLDLVAIATIADMVPLNGENRVLVHWGLHVLRKSPRHGIIALCNELRLKKSEITEDDIGFSIAPRINAASRMDEPSLAFKLLTTQDAREAERIATQLEDLNAKRKGVAGAIVREAKKRAKRFGESDTVVVLGSPEWKPALLGLAANSVMQDRGGVVCLWGRDGKGRLKGSCRSDGSISIVELFTSAKDSFEEFGGHAFSGGFSVSHERVHDLAETLSRAAAEIPAKDSEIDADKDVHDARITLPEITWSLFADVSRLAPFGAENRKPVFLVTGVRVHSVRTFGKEKNHIEVTLASDRGAMRAFDFFKTPENFSHVPLEGTEVRVLATLERDSFRGPAKLALRLVDILPA